MDEEEGFDDSLPVITLGGKQQAEHWEIHFDKNENVYKISGEKIEKFARRTNYDQYENVNRLRDIMKRLGIGHELSRLGAVGDSMVQIGDSEPFPLLEQ